MALRRLGVCGPGRGKARAGPWGGLPRRVPLGAWPPMRPPHCTLRHSFSLDHSAPTEWIASPHFRVPQQSARAWYLRQDTEKGWVKQSTNLVDIGFLCQKTKSWASVLQRKSPKRFRRAVTRCSYSPLIYKRWGPRRLRGRGWAGVSVE